MRRWLKFSILFAAVIALPNSSTALPIAINTGASEWVNLSSGEHAGAYPYVVGSTNILAVPYITLSPSIGVEWCPEFKRWGFIGSVLTDLPIANGIGFDTIVGFSHDQSGTEWGDSDFYLGLGTGLSIFSGPWSLSPSITVYGLKGPYLSPALNLGYTF